MRGCIITGGSISDTFAAVYLKEHQYDCLIAVDHGLAAIDRLNLHPDIVIGDFDSVDQQLLQEYQEDPTIRFETHNPVKDYTDTELAIAVALRDGWEDITILGGFGSRLDHTLANIHLLIAPLQKGVSCRLVDPCNKVYLLNEGRTFEKCNCHGPFISFLPLTTTVKGITLTGFAYPLFMRDFEIGSSLCISNELKEEQGTLSFTEGILICMECLD